MKLERKKKVNLNIAGKIQHVEAMITSTGHFKAARKIVKKK